MQPIGYLFIFATKRLHMGFIQKRILTATIAGAVVLFLFDGAFQSIPNFGVSAVERLETNELTATKLDERTNRMTYLVTGNTVSFVATKQAHYYNLPRFFAVEFLSALAIAFVFALLFTTIKLHSLKERIWLTAGFAITASFATHIPYCNWWGFSLAYTAGVVLKTVAGWLLAAFIQNRFIFKIK